MPTSDEGLGHMAADKTRSSGQSDVRSLRHEQRSVRSPPEMRSF